VGVKPDIELHIDQLVLHGFRSGERHRIGAAVERELGRLLAEQGLPLTKDAEVARMDGGTLKLSRNARAEVTGAEIARTVYGGLSGIGLRG
jgi:hypothetical protein